MSAGGKGSTQRPTEIPEEEMEKRWNEIFGKKKDERKEDDKRSEDSTS